MKRNLVRAASSVLTLSLLSAASFAGVVIESETKSADQDKDARKTTMWIEKDRIRAESGSGGFIFRGDKQVLWVLQEKDGKYMELTNEQIQKMGTQMSDAMAQMQESMKDLPPEQRKMMEQMMAGKIPAGGEQKKPEPRTFKKTGKSETINGYPCVSYDGVRGEKREEELWVTDWKRLELTPADLKALAELGAFMKDMVGPMANRMATSFALNYAETDKGDGIAGVPVRTITFSERGDRITELKKIARVSIPADKFELPAGLKKESMEGMPAGHAGHEGRH